MKNGQVLKIPLENELLKLLERLIKQNREVRKRYKEKNDYVFITKSGKPTLNDYSHNNGKRINAYSKNMDFQFHHTKYLVKILFIIIFGI